MSSYRDPLEGGTTLALYEKGGDTPVWTSKGRWLHPLLELEGWLKDHPLDRSSLYLHDTVQGRAAAALTAYIGIRHVAIDLVSDLALGLYKREGITDVVWTKKIPKIACCTEDLTTPSMSLGDVYAMIRQRAHLTGGIELRVENLSFSRPGRKILDCISFTLHAGDAMILSGENGSGKTTLLSCILGLLPLESGKVLFDGEEGLRDTAYVKQIPPASAFPLSVTEVVRMASAKQSPEETELALRRTGAWHLRNRNYFTLSGGEAQKVNLARALAGRARLLLLDEPTASLDPESRASFVALLQSLRFSEMPTMLLVCHDRSVIEDLGWTEMRLEGGRLAL